MSVFGAGNSAIDFTLQDANKASVSLSDFKDKAIVLYFYPKDDTPGCTREAIEFTENMDFFESNNTVVIGISPDTPKKHAAFCQKYELKVNLLSDPHHDALEKYDVWKEKKNYGRTYFGVSRSTFLIAPDFTFVKVWRNVKVNGHVDAVKTAIEALTEK